LAGYEEKLNLVEDYLINKERIQALMARIDVLLSEENGLDIRTELSEIRRALSEINE
jgi:hypothetical protein